MGGFHHHGRKSSSVYDWQVKSQSQNLGKDENGETVQIRSNSVVESAEVVDTLQYARSVSLAGSRPDLIATKTEIQTPMKGTQFLNVDGHS